ncbi:MAG: transglutaminaseTgpA domain-containing protein [Litorivicinus sp.]
MNPLRTDLPSLDQPMVRGHRALQVLAALASLPLAIGTLSWPLAAYLAVVAALAYHRPASPIWLRLALTAGCLPVLWFFRPGDQQGFFSAAILALTTLKMLEMKTLRDGQFLLNTALFGLFAAALITPTAWMSGLVIAGTAGLMLGHYLVLNPDDQLDWRRLLRLLRRTAIVSLWVLPLMVLMFYTFPRVGGQFFSLGLMGGATSGLTDRLEPGNLADLALSDTTRFRVQGDPAPTGLYYRVHVLEQFDGQTWRKSEQTAALAPITDEIGEPITIEMPAHQDTWLPLPEWPVNTPFTGLGGTFERDSALEFLWQAEFEIEPAVAPAQTLSAADRARLVQMSQPNPRTDAWLEPLTGQSLPQVLAKLSGHFRNTLFYSLRPPPADPINPVDALLFDSQTGFCGHFSHATAYALRRLGFPARVVIGFQGGRYNELGDYVQIRDADAHAWVEVHDQGRWQRVDPTAWIAPNRIDQGIDALGDALRQAGGIDRRMIDAGALGAVTRSLWQQVRDGMDWMQRGYTRWVVDFNQERQQRLFSGLSSLWPIAIVLLLGGLALWLYRRQKNQDRWLARFDRCVKRQGLTREPWQTPGQLGYQNFHAAWIKWRYHQGAESAVAEAFENLKAAAR